MNYYVVIVFCVVYFGLAVGRIPGLMLDRTGVALLGLIALLVSDRLSLGELKDAVDLPTIVLLFSLMVVSAQFRLGGFYTHIVRRVVRTRFKPEILLGLFMSIVGLLSAFLANDIVCLASTPILVEACSLRKLNPKPFLIGLACAANIGSAATLIGNPQNMLIGQVLHVSFIDYLPLAVVPAILGSICAWAIVVRRYKGKWTADFWIEQPFAPAFNPWQTSKGLAVLSGLVALFMFSSWPREVAALFAAGLLLCSRHMRSKEMLGLVDWQLLLLFISLFGLNQAMVASGNLPVIGGCLKRLSIQPEHPFWLFVLSLPLSNLVSNVPAVMILLPYATHPMAGPALALASTLAGNLIIVGSIANIIVVDLAGKMGVFIGWREHARVGVPVTLASMTLAGLWLWGVG